MSWIDAAPLASLQDGGRTLIRSGSKQIAIFAVGDEVYAVDNRCPHEGYPLSLGTIDPERCLLTCQWHNWKFDLGTGAAVTGEDAVRAYPVRVEADRIHVDITEPPVELRRERALRGVAEALEERQYGRLARELSRMILRGLDPLEAFRAAIERTHDRFEYGTTHAFAAAADWLSVYRSSSDADRRVACLTEALDHIAHDALRQPAVPFASTERTFSGPAFVGALEDENEADAVALVRGGLAGGMGWDALEPWFARAALAHYYDFGHAAIYVLKTRTLVEHLGESSLPALALALTRRIVFATREDLLPEFKDYADVSSDAPPAAGEQLEPPDLGYPLTTGEALRFVVGHLGTVAPSTLYACLLEASARNLLCFDDRLERAASRSVSRNVGWLSFTHAITFANAGRELSERTPELWTKVLLQMACFVGRNRRFIDPEADVSVFTVKDESAFLSSALERVIDHGRATPIYSAHYLKTLVPSQRSESTPPSAAGPCWSRPPSGS